MHTISISEMLTNMNTLLPLVICMLFGTQTYCLDPPIIFNYTQYGIYEVEGTRVEIFCNASGNPVPTIRWYKRKELDTYELIDTGSTLVFESIQRTDAGYYRCVASNSLSEQDQKTISVYVSFKPTTMAPFSRVGQLIGENATLECHVHGYPMPHIAWYKNLDKIVFGVKYKRFHIENVFDAENSKLVTYLNITDIVPGDFTSYLCSAENFLGASADGLTLYNAGIPTIQVSTPDLTAVEGMNVDLFCNATGIPTPNITWYREIAYDVTLAVGTGNYLHLSYIGRYQAGAYKCIASNSGPVESYRVTILTVEYPPEVSVKADVITVAPGTSVSIQCKAIGLPLPTIVWRKINSETATLEHKLQVVQDGNNAVNATMIINSMDPDDFGRYECFAENKHGRESGITEIKSSVPLPSTTKSQKSTTTTTTAAETKTPDTMYTSTQILTTKAKTDKVQITTPTSITTDVNTATESTGISGSSLPKKSLNVILFTLYFTFHLL